MKREAEGGSSDGSVAPVHGSAASGEQGTDDGLPSSPSSSSLSFLFLSLSLSLSLSLFPLSLFPLSSLLSYTPVTHAHTQV